MLDKTYNLYEVGVYGWIFSPRATSDEENEAELRCPKLFSLDDDALMAFIGHFIFFFYSMLLWLFGTAKTTIAILRERRAKQKQAMCFLRYGVLLILASILFFEVAYKRASNEHLNGHDKAASVEFTIMYWRGGFKLERINYVPLLAPHRTMDGCWRSDASRKTQSLLHALRNYFRKQPPASGRPPLRASSNIHSAKVALLLYLRMAMLVMPLLLLLSIVEQSCNIIVSSGCCCCHHRGGEIAAFK